jgi:putative addiction module component (TIGR02574 family)
MAAPDIQKLLELDLETRLALVQKLWDSIVEDANAGGVDLPLSANERDLLDQRLREDDEHPDAAIPWAEAKARLHQKR